MRLANKTALITGGNSGIGLATAKLFVAEGAKLAITGRNQATLDAAAKELGPNALALSADATDIAATEAAIQKGAEKFGKYHRDARKTFYGWADVWLDPGFVSWDIRDDYLPKIECPVLAIQGEDDEYGTMAQLDEMEQRLKRCELLKLPQCGHSPFRDQPEKVLSTVKSYLEKIR